MSINPYGEGTTSITLTNDDRQPSLPPSSSSSSSAESAMTSTKVADITRAIFLLLSSELPPSCPVFMPEIKWQNLINLQMEKKLVTLVSLEKNKLIIDIPEFFDIITHSTAHSNGEKWCTSFKERFRWWSTPQIEAIKPVRNCRTTEDTIRREFSLPTNIVQHPYLMKLNQDGNTNQILELIGSLFESVTNKYERPGNREAILNWLDKTQPRLTQTSPMDEIFQEEVDDFVRELDGLHQQINQGSLVI